MSRRFAALALALAALGGVLIGVVAHQLRGAGSDGRGSGAAQVRGAAVWPAGLREAPEFSLPDQAGRRFALGSLRGRPVILAFMDSQCHQECPLEGRALAAAFRMVPADERPVVVAVSVNPWADTPGSARRAIKRFGLSSFEWRWLLGSRAKLAPVWRKYGIEVRQTKGDIEHTDAIYLIDASGYERAGMVYPFLPTWVANDLEVLAGEESSS
ncbi:MAG TPA: SCO family protein [Solirubrobacterales bacterium]|nr:SCO family protein [Solirubrobacterales bacterium]